MGTQLAGDIGHFRPLEEVREPTFAKALVIQAEGCKLVLIQLDAFGLTTRWANLIREAVAEKIGTEPSSVMVCGTQNHGTPCLGDFGVYASGQYIPADLSWLSVGDEAYARIVVERAVAAALQANAALEPVTSGASSLTDGRLSFNRRFILRDGTVKSHPPDCSETIRFCEGPIDPEVGVACLRAGNGKVIAALLHFTCHPNHGYPHRFLTSDWPGAWSSQVPSLLGPQCVPLVLNGFCGNIHHHNHLDRHHVDDYHRMGRLLAETTEQILPRIEYSDSAGLAVESRHVPLPYRRLDPEKMREVRGLLARNPQPIWLNDECTRVSWDWMYAVSLLDLEADIGVSSTYPYEVQVMRLGDIGLVFAGGEPFVEGQLQIKMNSPARQTYVAHMANDACGYIPTAAAFPRGGYETNVWQWSKFAPEALERIVATATEMLHSVFA